MKLSIIIVNWNTKDLTKQVLKSIYSETKDIGFEIIIVDNNSEDGSVAMIKKNFPQVILIENKENLGFGVANNQGMKASGGEYIFLLNSDTIIKKKAIESLVNYLDINKDVVMVGPKLLNSDRTFQHACRRNLPNLQSAFFHIFGLSKIFKNNKRATSYKRLSDDFNKTEEVEVISGAAMIFRRKVFESLGGFDEDFFFYGEDLDLCKRIADNKWKIVYLPKAEIIHLGGESSKKRKKKSIIDFYSAMWLYYKKHFRSKNLFLVNFFVFLGIKAKLFLSLFANIFK